MGGENLENDVKFQIHGCFDQKPIYDRIIKDNVLITNMKFFYEKWQPDKKKFK